MQGISVLQSLLESLVSSLIIYWVRVMHPHTAQHELQVAATSQHARRNAVC
jgi:hypothetical protein